MSERASVWLVRLCRALALVVLLSSSALFAAADGVSAAGLGSDAFVAYVYDGASATSQRCESPERPPEEPGSLSHHAVGVAEAWDYDDSSTFARASAASGGSRVAPQATSLADDAVTTGRTASTSWGRTIDDFQQHGDQWRRVSAHAEGATGRAYRGGMSIEEVLERGGDRLVRHRIYGPNGEVLHETFRPYAKFGAP